MRTERRIFRPFDVPVALSDLLRGARLRIGESDDFVEPGKKRVVDPSELRSRFLFLEVAPDDETFDQALTAAANAAKDYGAASLEFSLIVTSTYLKLADVLLRIPLAELERVIDLRRFDSRVFRAVHHGVDLSGSVVLANELDARPLRPHYKATWLARATFALRTTFEGIGFTILPLTDARRDEFKLPRKTLRYIALDQSPLEADSVATVTVYLDEDLLARLNKTPRKNWARAFTDQLAVDVLAAVAFAALADPDIQTASWATVEGHLLGSLLEMVGGPSGGSSDDHYDTILKSLRDEPLKFLAQIEGALEMRDTAKLIYGGGA